MKFPVNKKLYAIHRLTTDEDSPNPNDLIQYLFLDKTVIPTFYGLESQIQQIDDMLNGKFFWDFLDKQAESGVEPIRHAIGKAMTILRKQSAFADRCTAILKKLKLNKVDEDLVTEYNRQRGFTDDL